MCYLFFVNVACNRVPRKEISSIMIDLDGFFLSFSASFGSSILFDSNPLLQNAVFFFEIFLQHHERERKVERKVERERVRERVRRGVAQARQREGGLELGGGVSATTRAQKKRQGNCSLINIIFPFFCSRLAFTVVVKRIFFPPSCFCSSSVSFIS